MIAAGVLVLGVVSALASEFRFRVDAADAARFREPGRSAAAGVAVVLRAAPEGSRIDLLTLTEDRGARWKWTDAGIVSAGRVRLRAPAASTALVVVWEGPGGGYRLDGPSRWPAESSERDVVARAARTVRGSILVSGAADEIRLAGVEPGGDPLCESDGGEWQCIGVPRAFSGRIAACRGGAVAGTAVVRADASAEAALRPVAFGALLRVEPSEYGPIPAEPSVRVLRPSAPKDFVTRADTRWLVDALGGGLVWIETLSTSPEALVEVGAPGHATKRFAILPDDVRCVEPITLSLPRVAMLRGLVTDPDGSPLESALVLVRSGDPGDAGAVLGDAETDAKGEFEISGVEPGSPRLRACHGEHGCAEETADPARPVVLRLPGRAAFIGRVLSSAGVPLAGAALRILPTEKTWTAADDRVTRLPLTSESGTDGRFRISAPENGDYLVEARTESSGVARVAVRRSNLSPRLTDLGDLRLPQPIEFNARVPGCASGTLFLSGPLGGETSLPALSGFRLDPEGSGSVRLPEGGAWTAWASCSGRVEWIEPAYLPDAAGLAGMEVRFGRAGSRSNGTED